MTGLEFIDAPPIRFRRPRDPDTDCVRVRTPREIDVGFGVFGFIGARVLVDHVLSSTASGWRYLIASAVFGVAVVIVDLLWITLARMSSVPSWALVTEPWTRVGGTAVRGPSLFKLWWHHRQSRTRSQTLF